MRKLSAKFVLFHLRKNEINLEKREFEQFVKDLAKEQEPFVKLQQYIEDKKNDQIQ